MTKNDTQTKRVIFTQEEFNALAYSIKARLVAIKMRAYLKYSGAAIRKYLDSEWEYIALVSLAKKLEID